MKTLALSLSKSSELAARLARVVPGGAHTYAKGADQYPLMSPSVIERGQGSRVWDADGNEYIEFGMGLRSVGLGHAYPSVVAAVRESLDLGTNFTRPSLIELDAAERFLEVISTAEMVKFTKDGSTATTGALKLARKATGRDRVAICLDHPFFSYDDWFMATTSVDGGIPSNELDRVVGFHYNDTASVERMFDEHPGQIAAVFLEAVRTEEPVPGFLENLRQRCDSDGALLVFDEMITGFRYALHGVQAKYAVTPDLSTFGKALANGFSVSALAGKREFMSLGSRERESDDVFLLSTTHGAETPGLVAAMATIDVYTSRPVIEHLYKTGTKLADGLQQVAAAHGLSDHVFPVGLPCNLMCATRGPDGAPSQEFRTLLLQEAARRGVLMPSLVVSYSHSDLEVDRAVEAIDGALGVYADALSAGSTDGFLLGPPSRVVFDRRLH